jgi:hypothetical protein
MHDSSQPSLDRIPRWNQVGSVSGRVVRVEMMPSKYHPGEFVVDVVLDADDGSGEVSILASPRVLRDAVTAIQPEPGLLMRFEALGLRTAQNGRTFKAFRVYADGNEIKTGTGRRPVDWSVFGRVEPGLPVNGTQLAEVDDGDDVPF